MDRPIDRCIERLELSWLCYAIYNILKEKEEGKVLKADVEEEPKVSAKDQRYREQVDEYNVSLAI